jgi:hypothetical protein
MNENETHPLPLPKGDLWRDVFYPRVKTRGYYITPLQGVLNNEEMRMKNRNRCFDIPIVIGINMTFIK